MKLLLLSLALITVGTCLSIVGWRRRHRAITLSDRWLRAQEQRDAQQGVDLPRWRSPKERVELARRNRLAQIAEARQRIRDAKRA